MLLCTSSSSFVKPVHLLPLWVEILASYKLTAASVWKLPLVKRSCLTQEKPVLSNWPAVKCNAWPFAWVENNSKVLAVHQRHCGTGWGCCSEWFIYSSTSLLAHPPSSQVLLLRIFPQNMSHIQLLSFSESVSMESDLRIKESDLLTYLSSEYLRNR